MKIAYVTSRLGCVGLPSGANFPLKSIEIYTAFDRLALLRVWEFPNCSHIDVMLENWAIR
jgi:hypothetical protein